MRTSILQAVVEASAKEYGDEVDIFVALDTKAQSTAGLAGVFIAAVVGFLSGENAGRVLTRTAPYSKWCLAICIALFVLSMIACLVGMRVRTRVSVGTAQLIALTQDLLGLNEERLTEQVRENYYWDQIGQWINAVYDIVRANRSKARAIVTRQILLLLGVILAATIAVAVLFIPGGIGSDTIATTPDAVSQTNSK